MTDDEGEHGELYTSDLVGRRLLGVTTRSDRPPGTAPSYLWLHVEELGPVRVRVQGPALVLEAVPYDEGTPVARDPQDVPLTRFVDSPIRSVRDIRYRNGPVDRVAGLALQFPGGDVRVLAHDGELVLAHDRHLGAVEAHLHEDVTLAQVVRTCLASPSQWDAWTTEGQYLYLRYRHGEGSVERHPSEDTDTWDGEGSRLLTTWDDGTDGGEIGLPAFLALAGLRLAPDAEVSVLTSWQYKAGRVWAASGGEAAGA